MKAAIVVPSIRRTNLLKFLEHWENQFISHRIFVVEDNPERTFSIDSPNVEHYSWKEIDQDLAEKSWIIPRRTDCIRSYGHFKAWQRQVDFVISMDDDCLPCEEDFISKHWEMLNSPAVSMAWLSTVRGGTPRGVPYFATKRIYPCVLNHGLWQGVPDFDAVTQLNNARHSVQLTLLDQIIPRGSFFPMCGMNLAFKTELAPVMYFLLMGKDWPYDRFGDIWCGIFVKRICDHLGFGVRSGHPLVDHQRASNLWVNLRKEALGYEVNETLWQGVDSAVLTGTTFLECYRQLAGQLSFPGEYWAKLRTAMLTWAELFAQAEGSCPPSSTAHIARAQG